MHQQGLLSGMKKEMIMGYFEEKRARQKQYDHFTHFVAGTIVGGLIMLGMIVIGRLVFGSPECVINGLC